MSPIPLVTATPLLRLSPKRASASSETVTTFISPKSKRKNGALSRLVTIDAIVDSHRVKNTIYKPTTGICSTTTQPYTSSNALVVPVITILSKRRKKVEGMVLLVVIFSVVVAIAVIVIRSTDELGALGCSARRPCPFQRSSVCILSI